MRIHVITSPLQHSGLLSKKQQVYPETKLSSGAGMHVLDVTPLAFKHLPGWEKAVAERETVRINKHTC